MKKKIFYAILICIILVGVIIISTIGLKADIIYDKSVRIDFYLGKEFSHNEVEEIAKEVFETNHAIVQQVEYYGDMFILTIPQNVENIDEKTEEFNNRIKEKYELDDKTSDMQVTYQPKAELSSILMPYLLPIAISMVIIIIYAIIRFKKIGIFKILYTYILSVLASETVYLSILAISRISINRIIIPIGLAIYIIIITIVTAIQEKKLESYKEDKKKNK